MKAVVCEQYGSPDVLQIKEVPAPVPKDNEIRVKIVACTVTAGDCRVRGMSPPPLFKLPMRFIMGFRKPRQPILGTEFAGIVESVGAAVTRFRPGDEVFGTAGFKFGAYAEYICMPENGALAPKPSNLTFEEAAAVPIGGLTALHYLRKGKTGPGRKALIYGASGSIGTYAVQLARYFGAEVTAVCSSSNAELARSLGAQKTIDYNSEDFTQNGEQYDLIFDTVGKTDYGRTLSSLTRNGFYLLAVTELEHLLRGGWTSMTSGKKVVAGVAVENAEVLLFLKERIEEGKLKPVIDRQYPLAQMADAHRYVDQGRKKGNVVIQVSPLP
ncbi:NAD(P)-dependent alcohol dehydrogenase [Paenibacillus sp. NPDC058071]|uniref:NAD(P)-dependent alcohol dehydrogenase n=1 Tax=Paenibacillus sp. NPDC058071 TaxID=3346326 RepID=UPI0036D9D4E7